LTVCSLLASDACVADALRCYVVVVSTSGHPAFARAIVDAACLEHVDA
jgi:hypothetical protein